MNDLDVKFREHHKLLTEAGFKRICEDDPLDPAVVDEFERVVRSAKNETEILAFLKDRPELVIPEMGMVCRWVKNEASFGSNFRADFLSVRRDSAPLRWSLVELESPRARWVTPSTRVPTRGMVKGMQQLDDWVQWISLNFEYATRAKPYGLGLPGINVNALTKVLIIGKRDIRPEADRVAMESAASGRRPVLDIHTYDFLLSEARKATRRRIADDASPCEECSLLDDL